MIWQRAVTQTTGRGAPPKPSDFKHNPYMHILEDLATRIVKIGKGIIKELNNGET